MPQTIPHPSSLLQPVLDGARQLLTRVYGSALAHTILFGSRARGDAREDSDIDVMVVLRRPSTLHERERVYEALSELCLEHSVVVSLTFVQEDAYRDGGMPVLLNVEREGIAL